MEIRELGEARRKKLPYAQNLPATPNLPTNIVDFGGFDSSIILV